MMMKIGNLETGKELSPEELTEWLISRTRLLYHRDIPAQSPEEFLRGLVEYGKDRVQYETDEGQELKKVKNELHNCYRMMDDLEMRLGDQIKETNEFRKRFLAASRVVGNQGKAT
jgi:hypothetical protein